MLDYFARIGRAVATTFEGMAVTMSWMFRKPSTIQYPFHPSDPATKLGGADSLPERYRGFLEVDMSVCSACLACERACPIDVISIGVEKVVMPGDPSATPVRAITRFDIDLGKCMFCGLCSEPCPTDAIHHTQHFEAPATDPSNLVARFVQPGHPVLPYKIKKDEPAASAPHGSILNQFFVDQRWDKPPVVFPEPAAGPEATPPADAVP